MMIVTTILAGLAATAVLAALTPVRAPVRVRVKDQRRR
jgi:hypothetical protein